MAEQRTGAPTAAGSSPSTERKHVVASVLAFALFAVVVVVAIVAVVAGGGHKSFRLATGAMEPTIRLNQRLTVDLKAYDNSTPRVGDIVSFHPPADAEADTAVDACGATHPDDAPCAKAGGGELTSETFVKRVVAVGPASVAIRGGRTIVNGRAASEPFVSKCDDSGAGICDMPRPITVPKGEVFVLGDNRGNSSDSRLWGPVPLGWMVGRVERCGFWHLSCHPLR